jgi:hypothetical protein
MSIDWARFAEEFGAERGFGTHLAEGVLERILGEENIARAVQLILDEEPGWTAAQSVLVHITSERAVELAYQAYQQSTGQRAVNAVFLIKDIAHPRALAWVAEFLADPRLGTLGIDVLDQLIWQHSADPEDPEVEALLRMAEQHPTEAVRQNAASVRAYAEQWIRDAKAREQRGADNEERASETHGTD